MTVQNLRKRVPGGLGLERVCLECIAAEGGDKVCLQGFYQLCMGITGYHKPPY